MAKQGHSLQADILRYLIQITGAEITLAANLYLYCSHWKEQTTSSKSCHVCLTVLTAYNAGMTIDPYLAMLLFTTASGSCILAGGLMARVGRIRPLWLEQELRHTIIAFGGGTLIAAVAFVLVPEGQEYFGSPILGVMLFLAGGVVFMMIERQLSATEHHLPQTLAMLLDFIPESLAMGGMFALGSPSAPLLAILIGLQNLPEGFNAYREILDVARHRTRRTLVIMLLLILLGPIAGMLGWHVAASLPEVVGAMMLFASGGILYLLFQDIAPQSRLERHWAPTLGAVLGFCLAMVADFLVTGN